MAKRLFCGLAVALMVALSVPGIASAHVLKVDGHIGAVLHINPDDNPTTGNSTDYILSFDDDTGKFSLPKCNCTASVIENGTALTTKPLVISSPQISEDHYTFQKPDVYTMRFSGQPKQPGAFQPFTLSYEVRVAGGANTGQPFPLLLWVGMAMGIGLILLAAFTMDLGTNEVTKEG